MSDQSRRSAGGVGLRLAASLLVLGLGIAALVIAISLLRGVLAP